MRIASLSIIAAAAGISIYLVAAQPDAGGTGPLLQDAPRTAELKDSSSPTALAQASASVEAPTQRVVFGPVTVIGDRPSAKGRAHR